MPMKKRFVLFVILPFLFAACQPNQVPMPTITPGAYPYPAAGEGPVMQVTTYPLPGDLPIIRTTAYPYPPVSNEPSGSASEPYYSPKPGDKNLTVGNVFLDIAPNDIVLMESYPVQVKLSLHGNLPTPCNQLRVKVSQPDAENRIQVEIYSVVDPNMICTQIIEPFDAQVSLGSYSSGKYTVYVNGEYLGEFTI